ncbi:hypothetical protein J8J14_14020 [Roseomonas sp. SSH11]|uniref:Uncharacterized protein n=1 Tax=Pararoseomonas baculiformis TaxID=2820812 RepID=A0ABS4AFT7_9PROT|nr:hypothetical protein [Pararoseomonas baculiformis]MBP0445889.1 hypothetical protein [Pararoseomonas baculiformis]
MPTPLEQFNAMAAAIAEAATQSQLGKRLAVTEQPRDLEALEVETHADKQAVSGRFEITMEGIHGSMAVSLTPSDASAMFEFQLVIALQGSDEQVVFTATVEDTEGLAETYQALLEGKRDPGEDPDIQNTVA